MENTTEQNAAEIAERERLRRIYNVVDWIDLGLVAVIIIYYSRLFGRLQDELANGMTFNLLIENTTLVGIAILLASLAISIVFICLTVMMRRKRHIGTVRAGIRFAWNGVWILLDSMSLLMILAFWVF